MTPSVRSTAGFTLVEILVACILLGVGLTAVIGLLLVSLQRARLVTAYSTIGPLATAAASMYAAHQQSGTVLIDPITTTPFAFSSPYAMRLSLATASGGDADSGNLKTIKVEVYDTIEDRDSERRSLAVMHLRQYYRP